MSDVPAIPAAPTSPGPARALLQLRLVSLRNLLRTHARRLRQPKYLAGFVFAAAYFFFFFVRPMHDRPGAGDFGRLAAGVAPLLVDVAALALFTIVSGMWLLAPSRPGFRFSDAEIAFLFPAPIPRTTLIHYKLLNTLFSSLLQTFLFALIFSSRNLFSGAAPYTLVAWWLTLSVLSLHLLAVTLVATRWEERGFGAGRRRAAGVGVLAALLAGCGGWIWATQPSVLLVPSLAEWARHALTQPPVSWILWPFRLLTRPFFVQEPIAFLGAIAPGVVVLLALYFWISRTRVRFEEAAIAGAARRADYLAAARRTGKLPFGVRKLGRRPAFSVALARTPELAFLWKNLLSAHAWFTPRAWLGLAAALVGLSLVLQRTMGHSYWIAGGSLAAVGAIGAAVALFYGPLLTRFDLRQDMANADVLKTYPLPGWRIVLGEILAPTAIVTGLIWLGLLAWVLGLHGHQPSNLSPVWLSPGMRFVIAASLAVVAPFIVAIELLVPNAAPVLLPGWFQAVRTPGASIDLMGQRLIFGFGQVLVVLLAMLPAAITAGGLIFLTQWFAGPAVAIGLATVAVIVVLLGELWCGVWWVGARFEKLDIVEARP